MCAAASRGDVSTVRELLERDPSLVDARGEEGRTALHFAVEQDRLDVARVLVDSGANLTLETAWGDTPLHWAGNLGATRVGRLLLDHGASDVNLPIAAGLGRMDLVRLMIDAEDPPRRTTPAGEPDRHWPAASARRSGDVLGDAFQLACRNGQKAVAELLLEEGANREAQGVFGGTGVHWAAIQGHEELVMWLLEQGADPHLQDPAFSATAAGWAREGGHEDLAERIEARNP